MYCLQYAALTHPGRVRENNEDNFYVCGCWKQDIAQTECQTDGEKKDGYLLTSVCDGIGGEDLGEEASLIAVETLHALCGEADGKRLQDDVMRYVDAANSRICERMQSSGQKMGTTFAALEFAENTVFATNLGDSRIYRLRDGALNQISTDHTILARMLRAGQITEEEAAVHPMRHHITQYFGIFPEEMLLEPADVPPTEVQPGDRYLLCSDGLTDMLAENEIQRLLGLSESAPEIARRLVQAALDKGGRDNVTVIVIRAEENTSDYAQRDVDSENREGLIQRSIQNLREFWKNSLH